VSHAFVAASIDHGYRWDADLNAPGSGGIGCFPTNSIDGLRQNVSSSYIEPAVTRANLIIRDRALARRVIFERSRAVGVEATVDGRLKTFRGDEIVLCAGGLKSPQLLMLSGIGPEPMLRGLDIPLVHASPFVGKGLMDDPGINIPFGISSAARTEAGRTLAEVCLNFAHPDCGSQEDLKLMVINYNWFMLLFGNMRGGSIAGRLGAASFLTRPRSTFRGFRGTSPTKLRQDFRTRNDLTMKCGIGPEASRGELRLVSANHEIPPEINLHYFSEPTDLRRMRAVVRTGCELLESRAFRSVGAVRKGLTGGDLRSDAALDAWIMSNLVTASHSSSTAKMGPPSDESAVVDQHCRVYGVDGLRVVDLSILPQLTRRGPNATAVMLGERAAGFFGD
jgi:choline dehydrogenase-like flavoprotein